MMSTIWCRRGRLLAENCFQRFRLANTTISMKFSLSQRMLHVRISSGVVPSHSYQPAFTGSFSQDAPRLQHPFQTDWFLKQTLQYSLSGDVYKLVAGDLERFGDRIISEIQCLHTQCEEEPPHLQQYNAYGNRVDRLITSSAWKRQKHISAEEGLVAIAYENEYQQYSRIYQAAKLYMYSPSSGLYGCPLAMTDGAAKTLKSASRLPGAESALEKAYANLTSREPRQFWTSGQWMTEKGGGSDVAGGTDTTAVFDEDEGCYKLYGFKWFSSATDADMSLALARIANPDGTTTPGTKGLSLFYLETKTNSDSPNGIQIVRLKNKLGTRQLPTAELLLTGTRAHLIGEPGRGVPEISDMLTITRFYNALFSSSVKRRAVSLCTDYSTRRKAFGKLICEYPLHMRTLANMQVDTIAATALTFEAARLLGLRENNMSSDEDRLMLRLLTPVTKLYTAKLAVSCVSEGLEAVGGLGYIEDTGLPSMLRDAQVLPIWEGTTNILSLDVLRAIQKTNGEVMKAFFSVCNACLSQSESNPAYIKLKESVDALQNSLHDRSRETLDDIRARGFAFSLARVYVGVLLLRMVNSNPHENRLQVVLERWCNQDLVPVVNDLQDRGIVSESDWTLLMTK